MAERCSHVQCGATATARVAFDALACFVWIDPYEADGPRDVSARGAGALCTRHADRLVPPRGWAVQDRRGRDLQLWSERPPVARSPHAVPITPRSQPAEPAAPAGPPSLSVPVVAILEPSLPFDGIVLQGRPLADSSDDAPSDIDEILGAASSPLLSRAFNAAHSRQAG